MAATLRIELKTFWEVTLACRIIMILVDGVGVEPTMFLMSRIYSPLPSPAGHIHPYEGECKIRTYDNALIMRSNRQDRITEASIC